MTTRTRAAALLALPVALLLAGCAEEQRALDELGVDEDAVRAVSDEVTRVAVALESGIRGTDYPTDLAGAVARIEELGLQPADGLVVGGYRYDPDAVEFTLCVEDAGTGAWSTYDTAPMSLREAGESGGCAEAGL